jgi:hypothetical protein
VGRRPREPTHQPVSPCASSTYKGHPPLLLLSLSHTPFPSSVSLRSGKSHTLRHLHRTSSSFPLDRFIWLDPDKIKSLLPDMPDYVRHNRARAGVLTHAESGFIAEIVELEAMRQRRCVVIDGSLRNAEWYKAWFARVRAQFPAYRIAILLITASRARIYERADRRAAVTARVVPRDVLDEAIEQVPVSFAALAPLADYTAVLDNDDDRLAPALRPPETAEGFKAVWADIGGGGGLEGGGEGARRYSSPPSSPGGS